jgi:hypothetical protein
MNQTIQEKNKALVLDAFDTLFNKRDYAAAEKYWSPNYIQHSAHIEPGRDGLFNLIHRRGGRLCDRCTDASQEPADLSPGSPRILSGSRTAASPNTGMFCRMKRPKPNRRAAYRCLAITSLPEPTYPSVCAIYFLRICLHNIDWRERFGRNPHGSSSAVMRASTGRNSDVSQRLHNRPVTGLNASDQSAICADTIYNESALTDSEKTR